MAIPSIKLNTGLEIPVVGLGCWMGAPGRKEASYEIVKKALEIGYRHFDMATRYGMYLGYQSILAAIESTHRERRCGWKGIRDSEIPRSEIFVTTKLIDYDHDDPRRGLEKSLKELNLEYIDLYLMHWPMARLDSMEGKVYHPEESPTFVDTWLEMEKLLDTGKVRSIGVSNFSIKNLNILIERANIVPAANEVELNPSNPQHALVDLCKSKGIQAIGYGPLGQYRAPFHTDPELLHASEKLGGALSRKISPSQLVLSWGVQRGTIVIPKSEKRLKLNFEDIFEIVDNYHKKHGMHRSLDAKTLEELGSVAG
ncbi:Aldo/kereductase family [Rhizoctonia solani]|uniref:Aldo/kereductase family n=1 Tax=Rhizoctonia solani TaxID=456999 RepID=A0A8H7H6V9_9AGAM|nr:Aldo/kereductase family [Rhizoctonia solani]